jgi:Tfp pilus assembly protein PilN
MQAVNLLPEYARPGRRWASAGSELSTRRILPIGGIAAIGLALLFGLFYFHERSVVSDKKSDLATAQARLVAQSARAEPIKQAQAESQARLTLIRAATATRVHWDSVMGDLGRVLPTGVALNSLSVASAAPVAGAVAPIAGSSFTVAGQTSSHVRVADVLDRLALLPWLTGITLQSSTRSGNVDAFSINATYVAGAGS